MDRSIKKSPLGLAMAWLQHGRNDKVLHDAMKYTLSEEASFQTRELGRNEFKALAADKGWYFQRDFR